jgi:hypothetical protein
MSNNRDLLNEAIADAKSVKEAAIANAKAALEESFAPYLAEKLKQKIAQLDEEEAYEEKEMPKEQKELEEKMSSSMMRRGDDEKKDGKFSKESKPEMETEKMAKKLEEKDHMDEMNLDELLAELEEESQLNEVEDQEEKYVGDDEKYEFEKGKEAGEEDEIDLEDMSEEDLKALIEDVIEDMVKAGEIEAGENFEEEDVDVDIDIDTEEEINERKKEGYDDREDESVSARMGKEAGKKQSFKARRDDSYGKFGKRDAEAKGMASGPGKNKINKEGMDEAMDENVMGKLNMFIQRVKDNAKAGRPLIDDEMFKFIDKTDVFPANFTAGIRKEEKDLEEMDDQIKELTSTLNEVKLLNAKLLYTNKIFRAKNLTENQKIKVLHAFDKASSVRETKLVFETLQTELKEKKAYVNESVRGLASKRAGVAPTTKQPILESNEQVTRWQKLAGIIKS